MVGQEIAIQVFLVLGVLIAAYLSLIRPQLKRRTEHGRFLASLKPGDRVVTDGGLIGNIVRCDDAITVEIELSNAMRIQTLRRSIDSHFKG
jgi:preprotein translocase subunit YajC